jgi:hypothetical protein
VSRRRQRAGPREWAVIQEALHRLAEHERLLRDVLPELRNRLTAAERTILLVAARKGR